MKYKQTALVTGTSSGIGRDITRDLAGKGYDLILVARRKERMDELAKELNTKHGTECLVLPCDLSNREQLNALMPRTHDWLEQGQRALTVLVNNAGTGVWAPFAEQSKEISQKDIDLNVTAPTTLAHEFIHLAQQHHQPSYILNVSSLAALLATPKYTVYSSTKSYVYRFTELLRYELRKTNISVTVMCPGGVLTEFFDNSGQDMKGEFGMMTSEAVAKIGVDAMLKRKFLIIPGWINKLSALVRFLPRVLRLPAVEATMDSVVHND